MANAFTRNRVISYTRFITGAKLPSFARPKSYTPWGDLPCGQIDIANARRTVTSVNATTPAFLTTTITNPTSNANLAFTLSGTALPTSSGGTGLNTVGTTGQYLASNGTTLFWETPLPPGTGTVTSVAATVPSFLSISGSPITTSGTLAITLSGSALPASSGGTGLTTVGSNGEILTVVLGTPTWAPPYINSVTSQFAVSLGTLALSSTLATTISDAFTTANSALALATTADATANTALSTAGTALALASNASAEAAAIGAETIALSPPSFLSVTGSPITLENGGTFTLGYSGTALPVANGGTG